MKSFIPFSFLFAMMQFNLTGQNADISLVSAEFLYLGVDNPVDVFLPPFSTPELTLTADKKAIIKKSSDGKFTVSPNVYGEITLTVSNDKKTFSKLFKIATIPDPIPTFNGQEEGIISIAKFKEIASLDLKMPELYKGTVIQSYKLIIGSVTEGINFNITGAKIPDDVLEILKNIKPGTIIHFIDIKGRCPGDALARFFGNLNFVLE